MKLPKNFHIILDKNLKYFCVDQEMENAWTTEGEYLGELECEKVKEGWRFKLKNDKNTNDETI